MALVKANNDCWFPFKAHIMNGEVSHKTLTLWIKSKLKMHVTPWMRSWQFRPHIYFPLNIS